MGAGRAADMYLALLLLAPALCEWVEISQHHYRKPVRTNHFQSDKATEAYEEITEENFHRHNRKPPRKHNLPKMDATEIIVDDTTSRYTKPIRTQYFPTEVVTEIYVDEGVTEISRHRYRKPFRTQHITTSDRTTEIYLEESTSEMSQHFKNPTHIHSPGLDTVGEIDEVRKRNRIYINQSISEANAWNKGNVDKVSKYGSVQRVQLDSNAVKAPNFKTNPTNRLNVEHPKDESENRSKLIYSTTKQTNSALTTTDKTRHDEPLNENFDVGKIKTIHNLKGNRPRIEIDRIDVGSVDFKDVTTENIRKAFSQTGKLKNNNSIGMRESFEFNRKHDPAFITAKDRFESDDTFHTHKIGNFERNFDITSRKTFLTKSATQAELDPLNVNTETSKKWNQETITDYKHVPLKDTKPEKLADEDFATVSDEDGPSQINKPHLHSENGEEDQTSNPTKEPSNANILTNLMTLMNVVADTIKKNTKKSVNSKTKYLANLKDTILSNIKERIDSTWPDDGAPGRVTRAAQAAARGHLEIPSSESALMTISFLTFAVFLIKLVLQVIQTYKNKTMMLTPAVVATVGRAAAAKRSVNN